MMPAPHRWLLVPAFSLVLWAAYRSLGVAPVFLATCALVWPLRRRQSGQAVLWAMGLVLAVAILQHLRWVVYPLVGGILLAMWLQPTVEQLTSRRVPRGLAAVLALLPLLLGAVVAAVILVPTLIGQVSTLVARAPEAFEIVRRWADEIIARLPLEVSAPSGSGTFLGQDYSAWLQRLESLVKPAAASAAEIGRGIGQAARVLGATLLAPLVAYYLLVDWNRLQEQAQAWTPPRFRPAMTRLGGASQQVLGRYLRGQFLVAGIEAVLFAIGFTIAGLDGAIALGLLGGLFSLLPVVGFGITMLMSVLASLIAPDPVGSLTITAIVLTVIQIIEGQVLVPRVQGTGLGLHPLVVLLGVLAFGILFGVPGALLAAPILGIVRMLGADLRAAYEQSWFHRGDVRPTSAALPAPGSSPN